MPTQWGCIANVTVRTKGGDQIVSSLAPIYYVNDSQDYAERSGFYITGE